MAIGTVFLLDDAGEERFVLFSFDFFSGVTAHTERINLCPWIHNIWWRAVFTPGPGFVRNVLIALAMAIRAADIGQRVYHSKLLVLVVDVANVATAVISYGAIRWTILFGAVVTIKQQ